MKSCNSIYQDSLGWCEGKSQYAGIRRRMYYTARTNVLEYPKLPRTEDGDYIASAVLEGQFTLKEGAFFHYIDILPEKSQATSEAQGEYPSQTSLDKVNLIHPGVGPEASMAAAYLHNSDNVVIIEDTNARARVIGIENPWPTKATVSMDFGQGAAGTASTTIAIEGTNKVPFPQYVGAITTKDGIVDFSKN